jgi:hypothetical protein
MAYLVEGILKGFKEARKMIGPEHPQYDSLATKRVITALAAGCISNCQHLSPLGRLELEGQGAFDENGLIRPEVKRSAQLFAMHRYGPGVKFHCRRDNNTWTTGQGIQLENGPVIWERTDSPLILTGGAEI